MSNVLYLNKPKGISSFDLCFKLRKILNTKKIGHTGTLDPNATGVMIILYDNSTKAAQFLVSDTKTYKTKVLFGIQTDTLDIDGNIMNRMEKYIAPSFDEIDKVLKTFKGISKQIVPITSAKKINGKKLYQYQYEGKQVDLPEIDINVYDIELNEVLDNGFIYTCKVSSGTYIRSLTRDILEKLNIIGTVDELERINIDGISIDDCDSLDDVINGNYHSHDLLEVLKQRYTTFEVDNDVDIKNGKPIKIDSNDETVIITHNGELLAMYKKDHDLYRCARGMWND